MSKFRSRQQTSWHNPGSEKFPDAQPTQFEGIVAKLGLMTEAEMLESSELKLWVRRHKDTRYVPEGLLKKWGFAFQEGTGRFADRY